MSSSPVLVLDIDGVVSLAQPGSAAPWHATLKQDLGLDYDEIERAFFKGGGLEVLRGRLSYALQTELESLAPTHFVVPSGSRLPIDYESEPALTVRLQEMFGLAETPRVGGNRVPLLLKLTSPAGRPVQVTRDLASFWSRGYAEVRKELKGRYPKHYWPDDPLTAAPTARARPRP